MRSRRTDVDVLEDAPGQGVRHSKRLKFGCERLHDGPPHLANACRETWRQVDHGVHADDIPPWNGACRCGRRNTARSNTTDPLITGSDACRRRPEPSSITVVLDNVWRIQTITARASGEDGPNLNGFLQGPGGRLRIAPVEG